jgi:hypothetical protein
VFSGRGGEGDPCRVLLVTGCCVDDVFRTFDPVLRFCGCSISSSVSLYSCSESMSVGSGRVRFLRIPLIVSSSSST